MEMMLQMQREQRQWMEMQQENQIWMELQEKHRDDTASDWKNLKLPRPTLQKLTADDDIENYLHVSVLQCSRIGRKTRGRLSWLDC